MERRLRFEVAGIDATDGAIEVGGGAVLALVREDSTERLQGYHVLAVERDSGFELGSRFGQPSGREITPAEDDMVPDALAWAAAALLTEPDCLLHPALLAHPLGQRKIER